MATTTTIYADTDANPRSGNPDTNYSGSGVMRTGQFSGGLGRRHFVMSFDVSAYTNPSDIVSANLKLFYQSSGGGSQRNMKLVRLNQTFVESEVTWNSASSGVAWTGGAGGEGNGEFTQPVYTIVVGTGASNPEVDIRDLVVDAITRREGTLWLILCFDPADTSTVAGFSLIYPSETPSTTSDPQIDVVVADRIVWSGASNNDVGVGANWVGGVVPTASDIALFSNGNNQAGRSTLTCYKCFVGGLYKGNLGSSSNDLSIDCVEFSVRNRYAGWHVEIGTSVVGVVPVVRIGNTSSGVGSCSVKGLCSVIVNKSRSDVEILESLVTEVDVHGGAKVTLGDRYTVRATKSLLTFNDGFLTATLADNTSAYVEKTSATKGDITVAGQSVVTIYAEEVDELTIYSGRVGFRGNDGAPIVVGTTKIYNNGVLDTRTSSTNFSLNGSDKITSYGGKTLFDASTETTIT